MSAGAVNPLAVGEKTWVSKGGTWHDLDASTTWISQGGEWVPFVPTTLHAVPSALDVRVVPGESKSETVTITASPEGKQVTVTSDQPWLTAAPSSGAAPLTLDVTVDAAALAEGAYTASLTVATSGADTLVIPVSVDVAPAFGFGMDSSGQLPIDHNLWSGLNGEARWEGTDLVISWAGSNTNAFISYACPTWPVKTALIPHPDGRIPSDYTGWYTTWEFDGSAIPAEVLVLAIAGWTNDLIDGFGGIAAYDSGSNYPPVSLTPVYQPYTSWTNDAPPTSQQPGLWYVYLMLITDDVGVVPANSEFRVNTAETRWDYATGARSSGEKLSPFQRGIIQAVFGESLGREEAQAVGERLGMDEHEARVFLEENVVPLKDIVGQQ